MSARATTKAARATAKVGRAKVESGAKRRARPVPKSVLSQKARPKAKSKPGSVPGSKTGSGLWEPLRPGDVVDVVAPGFSSKPEVLEGAAAFLRSWGLVPRIPDEIFGSDILCANRDEIRLRLLSRALLAKDSKAVWCMRGGYGSIRLVPDLLKLKKPARPKLFIGFSDITTLHVFLNQKWAWPTVHGPVLDRLGQGTAPEDQVRELKNFVFGELPSIEFKGLKPLNAAAHKSGEVRAPVVGGNLITLQSTIATGIHWQTAGKILFFEEIGERGYRVDRVLEQMEQVGMFKKVRGIVFGDFTGGLEPGGNDHKPEVISRFAEKMKIPVFGGVESGHGESQRPVPFGTFSVLVTGANGTLVCETGAGPRGP